LLFDLGAKGRNFIVAQSDDDFMNGGNGGELAQSVDEDRNAAQLLELFAASLLFRALWRGRGHARAQSGCGNDDNTFIGAISIVQGLTGCVQASQLQHGFLMMLLRG